MAELISRREFGRRMGVSHTAIRKAIEEGRISVTQGKIDYESAREAWARTRGPGNNNRFGELIMDRPPDVGDCPDYYAEKTRLTAAQAEKAELEVEMMRSELHHAEDVEAVMNHMVAAFRSRTLELPKAAAREVRAASGSLGEIQTVLTRHIHALLTDLSKYDPESADDGRTATKTGRRHKGNA